VIIDEDSYLEHYGVKGMRWGVRNERTPGVSRKTDRDAAKDAAEFSRAKMYYGKGAGTRRKLIKATVEAKSKKDPAYATAFQAHLSKQDMSRHASKARSERSRTDKADTIKKSTGFLARQFTGEMGTKAALTAVAVMGIAFFKSDKGQKIMTQTAAKAKMFVNRNPSAIDFLRANGLG
jgi:hypothetical protein